MYYLDARMIHSKDVGHCYTLVNPDTMPSPTLHGYPLHGGILNAEAIYLLWSFYDRENFNTPDHQKKRKDNIDEDALD